MTTPRTWRPDWEAFGQFVDGLRREHEARTEAEAVAVSLAAFNRWGVRPPREFFEHAAVVTAHRTRDNATPDEVHT
jgi:hypothetical protein